MSGITWLTEPIVQNYEFLVVVTLMLILVVIVIALLVLLRKQRTPTKISVNTTDLENLLTRAKNSIEHVADVSAVVVLVRQLNADPDALELIKSYPETVRAAAMLHYVNTLGADLQTAHKALSTAHRTSSTWKADNIKSAQADVDSIQAKLDAAVERSGQIGLRPVV